VSFTAITLCVASERVIPKVSVYFVIDSVRKLLDYPCVCVFQVALTVPSSCMCLVTCLSSACRCTVGNLSGRNVAFIHLRQSLLAQQTFHVRVENT
jgi:hypothetical protein